jgi:iron(III) transport system ATP-binding protein
MTQLQVKNLTVRFDELSAVNDVSFSLEPGEIGSLLGPSGCGKTTVLRAIAGFEQPAGGEVLLHGKPVSRAGWALAAEKRRVGMVFQDFALFPHLNVADNIGFGLRGLDSKDRKRRIDELLDLVGLGGQDKKFPHTLSGGQQQRVALARAIAPRPSILLLDEPFSGIDVEFREQLARDVRSILKQENITALLVTHDQLEAFAVADHIGVMNTGRLHQWAAGYTLYHEPADLFVADFIGRGVLIKGVVLENRDVHTDLGIIKGGEQSNAFNAGDRVDILIRPDDIIHDDASAQTARVTDKAFQGAEFLYTLELQNGTQVLCFAPSHHDHPINESIGVRLELDHLVMFKSA